MATEENESTIESGNTVRVPDETRQRADLQPGDRLRWTITDEGALVTTVVREASGTATDLDPVDVELGAVEAVREVREDHYSPFCAKGLAASLSTTNPTVVLLRNPTYVRT